MTTGAIRVEADDINASLADIASSIVKGLSLTVSFNFFATSKIVWRVIPGSNLLDKFLVIMLLSLSII